MENFPRQYIANICYTVIGEPFYDWVQTKIDSRNDRIMKEKQLGIEMDPVIYKAFMASNNVSGKRISIKSNSMFSTFSLKRQQRQPTQGGQQEEAQQAVDQGGEVGSAAKGAGDPGQAGLVRLDAGCIAIERKREAGHDKQD